MTEMVEVTKEDANNYCMVLTLLGLEEEGDPIAEINKLKESAIKSERIAIAYSDVIQEQVIAMRAAIADAAINDPEKGIQWIINTLAGPGHLPDIDEAVELGGAQALFNKEMDAHHEFRLKNPAP